MCGFIRIASYHKKQEDGAMKKLVVGLLIVLSFSIIFLVPNTQSNAEQTQIEIYFFNSKGWDYVYAHCYVLNGPSYDAWPGNKLEEAVELGNGWFKCTLPSGNQEAALRVQFNDGTEDNSIDVNIADSINVYFNAYRRTGFPTKQDALDNNSEQIIDSTGNTRIYFYNSKRWKTVYAYAYGVDETTEYTKKWPGNLATKDEERENWYYIEINQDASEVNFLLIFNNKSSGAGNQSTDTLINNHTDVYLNYSGKKADNYETIEETTVLEDVVEEIILVPEDFYLDFSTLDTKGDVINVTEKPSVIAPIIVSSVAFVALLLFAILLLIRRKQKC